MSAIASAHSASMNFLPVPEEQRERIVSTRSAFSCNQYSKIEVINLEKQGIYQNYVRIG